ncbi:hypothetical protein C3L33_17991, partial [Rhododendron williamsianum]
MAAAIGNLIRKLQHFSSTHVAKHHDIVVHLEQIEKQLNVLQPYLADAEWKRDVHESQRKMVTHGGRISWWVLRVAVLAEEVVDIIVTCDLRLMNMNIGDSTFSKLLHYWLFTTNDNLTAKIQMFLSRFPQENELQELLRSKIGIVLPAGHKAFVTSWPYSLFWMDFVQYLWGQFSARVTVEIAKLNLEALIMRLTKNVQAFQPRPARASRKAIQMIIRSIGLLGRADDLKQLRGWLLAAKEEDSLTPTVIAVNGEAGIGKTCMAKGIYESLQKHFDCHAWIFVSPNRTRLLLDILRGLLKSISVAVPGNIDALDEATMKQTIRHLLVGKKFLLVLDDLPTQQELDYVKDILPSGCRAKILLTSRSDISGCAHVLVLKSLSPQDSFNLFRKCAFLESQNNTFWSSIESEANEILKTCERLPLAIVTIGGMLSTKQMATKEWSKVRDMLKEANFISLCYADLDPVLKSCFLYAASFPSQHEISCKKLQRLWIAEGIVKEADGKTVEEATSLQLTSSSKGT